MIKLSWSYIAAIFYLSFVVFIVWLAYLAMREKFELITPNYYAEELKYQHKIDAKANVMNLSEPTTVEVLNKQIVIDLPKDFEGKKSEGTVSLLRPSDESKDLKFTLKTNEEGKQSLSSPKFVKGLYILKMDWKCEGKDYYLEQNVFLK
ncbi:FixH family protein [Solitalea sp. MAHUQ-68]|uniref:FixH family protein n=1 Tax=Solitalea agri TaxID=2953739 RepID=A0A9X2F4E5_9SPHI|nr:FixH family protein [Solitalea agri]MCO4291618.1 FixH family protein [Solitalea agri]